MHSWGKLWTRYKKTKKPKKQKKSTATFKEPGAKTGCWGQKYAAYTQHQQMGGQNTQATPPPTPGHTLTLTTSKEPAHPSPPGAGRGEGDLSLVSPPAV